MKRGHMYLSLGEGLAGLAVTTCIQQPYTLRGFVRGEIPHVNHQRAVSRFNSI